jgi:hypothetical protein
MKTKYIFLLFCIFINCNPSDKDSKEKELAERLAKIKKATSDLEIALTPSRKMDSIFRTKNFQAKNINLEIRIKFDVLSHLKKGFIYTREGNQWHCRKLLWTITPIENSFKEENFDLQENSEYFNKK